MSKDKTFVRITNQHIYDKLIEVEKHVLKTNGKVILNKWLGSTALTLIIVVIGWLFAVQ